MASKSIHQPYNEDALKHFGFEEDPIYGVYSDHQINKVLVTDDSTTYEKIGDYFDTETITGQQLVNYKKAFVLPGCPISTDRVKEAAKEHKISITNDYEKADIIIVHDETYKYFEHGERIGVRSIFYKLWNYDISDNLGTISFIEDGDTIIIDDRLTEYYGSKCNNAYITTLLEGWVITGLAVNIAYLIEQKSVEVIGIDSLLNSSASKQVLTEELLDTIKSLRDSGTTEDTEMLFKVLPTIDYNKNHHLLWQLSQWIYSSLTTRDKDLSYWIKNANLSDMYYESAEDCLMRLHEDDMLTKEGFKYLEKIARKRIDISNRELYVFKVNVKREYKKYLL